MRWHTKFGEIRKRKRENALDNYLKTKRLLSLTHFFSHWRQRENTCLSFQGVADEIRNEKESRLLEDLFFQWREKISSISRSQVIAEDHHRAQILQYPRYLEILTVVGMFFTTGGRPMAA
jgi:hypothetical protein